MLSLVVSAFGGGGWPAPWYYFGVSVPGAGWVCPPVLRATVGQGAYGADGMVHLALLGLVPIGETVLALCH